jgi:hypothetical protein
LTYRARGSREIVRWADDSGEPVTDDRTMSSSEIRTRLIELAYERVAAERAGLGGNRAYMADLEDEIVSCRHALVGTAVTEIAVLRAALFGRQLG